MTAERRTEDAIRTDIASQREQLATALRDLRAGIDAKRKPVAVAAGALAAGLATLTAAKVLGRRSR